MSEAPTIRVARRGDLDALLALEALFVSDRLSRRSLRRFLGTPAADVMVAECDGAAAGDLILLSARGRRLSRVYSLIVAPALRGRGTAAALIDAAEHRARARGRAGISLEVRVDNAAARRLYARLGYSVAQTLAGYYDDGADGLRLVKLFDPEPPEPAR